MRFNLGILFCLSFSSLVFGGQYTELFKLPLTQGQISAIAVDPSGNVYLTGTTNSTSFPSTPGSVQPVYGGGTCFQPSIGPGGVTLPCRDAFVIKMDPTGKVVYATYLGGSGDDFGYSIAADAQGNAYVSGITVTPGPSSGNMQDGYVTKINPQGTAIVYSRAITAAGYAPPSVAVDSSGSAYFTGTASPLKQVFTLAFSATPGAFQTTPPDNSAGFKPVVVKLSATGSVVYATWVTGSNMLFTDYPAGIAVDSQGNAYITGSTHASDFPVTPGVIQALPRSPGTAFVAKVNPSGSSLVYSTYLGGSVADSGQSIRIDAQGRAYLVGRTASLDFPVTPGAFEPTALSNNPSAFLSSLNAAGTALNYSTYLDGAQALDTDAAGNTYVAGISGPGFPVTSGAYQRCIAGGTTGAFVAQFDSSGKLARATYVGGPQTTGTFGMSIAAIPGTLGSVFVSFTTGTTGIVAKLSIDDPQQSKPGPCSAQAIENGATFLLGAVSPGEIVTLRGDAFAPDTGVASPGNRVAPTRLNGVQIFFDEIPAPLLYAQSRQINAIVPWELAGRTQTTIHVEYNGASTMPFTVPIAQSAPGLFFLDYVTAQGAIQNSDGTLNSRTNPAARGSYVAMYGSGGGLMSPAGVTGGVWPFDPLSQILLPVTVQINSNDAPVAYAGAAPGLTTGIFQINVRIPDTVQPSSALPIRLSIGGNVVITTTIAVK